MEKLRRLQRKALQVAADTGQTLRNQVMQLHMAAQLIIDADDWGGLFAGRENDGISQAQWQGDLANFRSAVEGVRALQGRALRIALDAGEAMGRSEGWVNESTNQVLSLARLIHQTEQGRSIW